MLPLPGQALLKRLKVTFLFSLVLPLLVHSQDHVSGKVQDAQGRPVENALLLFSPGGQPVYSDSAGFFQMNRPEKADFLLVSATGFRRDTIRGKMKFFEIILKQPTGAMQEILISEQRSPGQLDYRKAGLSISIDRQEMRKAACCNLSESFETSLVDVSFPDPVSGIRHIQMLGLSKEFPEFIA